MGHTVLVKIWIFTPTDPTYYSRAWQEQASAAHKSFKKHRVSFTCITTHCMHCPVHALQLHPLLWILLMRSIHFRWPSSCPFADVALPVPLLHAFSIQRDSIASTVVNLSHARHPLQVPRVLPIYVTGKKGWWSWRGSSRQKKLILQIWPPNVFGVFFCPNHAMAVLLPMLCYHVPARWVAFAACLWKNWQQTEWNKEKLGVNGAPSHVICYGLGVSLSKWLQRGQVIKIGLFQLGLNLFHRRFRLFLAARSRYLPTVLLELHPLLLMPTVVIF